MIRKEFQDMSAEEVAERLSKQRAELLYERDEIQTTLENKLSQQREDYERNATRQEKLYNDEINKREITERQLVSKLAAAQMEIASLKTKQAKPFTIVTYAHFEEKPIEELVSHLRTLKEDFTKDGSTDEEALSAALRRFFSISCNVDWDPLGVPKLKKYVSAVLKAGFVNDKNWSDLRQNKKSNIKSFWSDARRGELMLVMKWVLFPDKRDIFKLNLE